jgi:hypothetical protein
MSDLLVILDNIADVIAPVVVSLPHAHGVMREVNVAVVAEECTYTVSLAILYDTVGGVLIFRHVGSVEKVVAQESKTTKISSTVNVVYPMAKLRSFYSCQRRGQLCTCQVRLSSFKGPDHFALHIWQTFL